MNDKEKLRKDKTAGFFLDMAKLSFAGMVIGSVVSITEETSLPIILSQAIVGTLLTIVFARVGFMILN